MRTSIIGRLPGRLNKLLAVAGPFVLFAYGTWTVPLAVFDPSRALIPGDLGDSRFNNYVLEHFHQYASGKVPHYWDAPFMYPYKNVIALSDNLLGTAPLYSLFRHAGFNRESAYQLWILALFSLNYICCFGALFRWSNRSVLSACGAYVFAFGIHMLGQMDHVQVFPKFMVPLAFWFCWQWLHTGRAKHMLLTALAVVYQFYCGLYLGFFLCYGLLFLVIAHGILDFRKIIRARPLSGGWRSVARPIAVLVLAFLLLWPLMAPYMRVAEATGMRGFAEVKAAIPQVRSYFFTHPGALSWRSLSTHSGFAAAAPWSHFLFVGAVPWIAILLLPFVLWKWRAEATLKRPIVLLTTALFFSTLFSLRIGDFTLYALIHHIPGFGAMRAIDRIINVQVMYFVALMVMVFSAGAHKPWSRLVIGACLPIAVVVDNMIDTRELNRYDKYAARALVDRAVLDMQLQKDATASAIAYTPARGVLDFAEDHERSIRMHLTAMLAAQQSGIPIVNAYTGSYPGNYMQFWDRQDQRSLDAWCAFNGTTSSGIRVMNNIHRPILDADTVHIVAANGKYVCVDVTKQEQAIADKATAQQWETFVRLRLSSTDHAFVAHTDLFLSAELFRDSGLVAISDRLGDMGVFKLEEQADGRTAIRADNGMYVTLDSISLRLVARTPTVDAGCLFRFERTRK